MREGVRFIAIRIAITVRMNTMNVPSTGPRNFHSGQARTVPIAPPPEARAIRAALSA